MNADFSEKVALFYYFSFLDETKAQAATAQTLKKISGDHMDKSETANKKAVELVRVTNAYVKKTGRHIKPTSLAFSVGYITLPENSNWGPWFEFRKVASENDFSAVLYVKVLQVSEEAVAKGLNIPLGTVRYRVGRGLKTLGRICQLGSDDAE